ncbi:MAG: metal ABC transporter substrate-binding protein [Marmoricola sp.]
MLLRRLVPASLALTVALAGLSGCASAGGSEKPQVVASFYPLQYVAERIVGDHAEVLNLTKPGVEPHELELSPRQTASLSTAEVVLYEKGLSPAVDEAIGNDAPKQAVDAASVVGLHKGDGGVDPHFWLDPTLLAKTATAFSEAMQKADPDHAADYQRNGVRLHKDLLALDGEIRGALADCRIRTLVVSHDAFEYFARRYGLTVDAIAGLSPDAEPSAKRLSDLADLVREKGVTTIFSERLLSPRVAETLAGEAGVRTEVLDPLEGLAKGSKEDYVSLMRENVQTLRAAGECA